MDIKITKTTAPKEKPGVDALGFGTETPLFGSPKGGVFCAKS